jgi:hypothetical protein
LSPAKLTLVLALALLPAGTPLGADDFGDYKIQCGLGKIALQGVYSKAFPFYSYYANSGLECFCFEAYTGRAGTLVDHVPLAGENPALVRIIYGGGDTWPPVEPICENHVGHDADAALYYGLTRGDEYWAFQRVSSAHATFNCPPPDIDLEAPPYMCANSSIPFKIKVRYCGAETTAGGLTLLHGSDVLASASLQDPGFNASLANAVGDGDSVTITYTLDPGCCPIVTRSIAVPVVGTNDPRCGTGALAPPDPSTQGNPQPTKTPNLQNDQNSCQYHPPK